MPKNNELTIGPRSAHQKEVEAEISVANTLMSSTAAVTDKDVKFVDGEHVKMVDGEPVVFR
jgi:hypothetical protein